MGRRAITIELIDNPLFPIIFTISLRHKVGKKRGWGEGKSIRKFFIKRILSSILNFIRFEQNNYYSFKIVVSKIVYFILTIR